MAQEMVLISVEDLRALIRDEIKSIAPLKVDAKLESDNLDADSATDFLNSSGFKISKSSLYVLTHKREVPFQHFGNRLVFSKKELLSWAESRLRSSRQHNAIDSIAQSARRKSR